MTPLLIDISWIWTLAATADDAPVRRSAVLVLLSSETGTAPVSAPAGVARA